MGDGTKFSALNTKLQGMRGKLTGKRDYKAIKNVKSVPEMANYLYENTHFRKALEGNELDQLHRGDLEILLRKASVNHINDIIGFLAEEYRGFIKAVLLRFEVEDISLLLRTLNRGEALEPLEKDLLHVKSYSHGDFDRLLASTNVEDFMDLFRGTIFEEAFRSMTQEDLSLREFHIEMNMDMIYYRSLLGSGRSMDNENRQVLKHSVGTDIDLINMRWIYRSKKFYKLSNEEILNYTLTGGRKFEFTQLKDIIYSENFETPLEAIAKSHYQEFFSKEDVFLEVNVKRFMLDKVRKLDIKHPMTIAKLICYIHELVYEVDDVISMIEGIRYGVDFEEFCIRQFDDNR